jgi:dolichyl-phosphate-mannose-protein mannosyltransferase
MWPEPLSRAARAFRHWLIPDDEPPSRVRTLVLLLCAVGIGLGVVWRFQGLHYPPTFSFDEHHFVQNARNYLRGLPDWNDHPPLGKLLMLPGMLLFGDNGLGWRVHEAVLGTVHIFCVFLAAAALFGDRRTGLLAATFVALDGLFISYSRTALLDIPMNAFMMGALALMLGGRHLGLFAAAAALIGLAVGVKWIAVCLALVVPLLLRRQGRSVLHAAWMGGIAVAIYFGIVALALRLTHQPVSPGGLWHSSLELLRHHAAFTDWRNPIDSRWYTWPFLHRPFLFHREMLPGDRLRLMSSVGNPWLWYLTTAAFAVSLAAVARGLWQRVNQATPLPATLRREGLLLITAVALILQWILSNRESYLWHYMGTYSVGLILLAGYFAPLWRAHAARLLVLVGVTLAVAIFYSPVWAYGVLPISAARWRLFVPGWW